MSITNTNSNTSFIDNHNHRFSMDLLTKALPLLPALGLGLNSHSMEVAVEVERQVLCTNNHSLWWSSKVLVQILLHSSSRNIKGILQWSGKFPEQVLLLSSSRNKNNKVLHLQWNSKL